MEFHVLSEETSVNRRIRQTADLCLTNVAGECGEKSASTPTSTGHLQLVLSEKEWFLNGSSDLKSGSLKEKGSFFYVSLMVDDGINVCVYK